MFHISLRHLLTICVFALMLGACSSNLASTQESSTASPAPLPSSTSQAVTVPSPQATIGATQEPPTDNTPVPTQEPPTDNTPVPTRSAAQQALFLGPDGKLQAATTINREIALVTTLPADAQALTLSPNGGSLAFIHDGQVFVRALDTSTDTVVVSATLEANDIAFSPDGQSLLYAIDTSEDALNQPQPQLYLSQLDGQPARLFGSGFAPVWSPTGAQIAFLGPPFEGNPAFGGGPGGRVMLAPRDGGNPRPVGEAKAVHPAWQPIIWSKDGTRLAAGSELIDAMSGAVIARGPESTNSVVSGIQAISTDGHAFAYWHNLRSGDAQSDTFTERDELLMISDNGQSHRIAQTTPRECPCLHLSGQLRPVWAPSGNRFAIADPRLNVRLYTPDGLPLGGYHVPKGTQSGNAFDGAVPFWSEDGEALLLSLSVDGHDETWILHTGGGMWRRLGTGVALGWRN